MAVTTGPQGAGAVTTGPQGAGAVTTGPQGATEGHLGAPARAGRPLLVALRALGLGDLLTAVPALRALAEAFPDHHRVLVCGPTAMPLAPFIGAVDEVVPSAELAPLHPALTGADVAVNLHGAGPASHRLLVRMAPVRLMAFAHPEVAESAPGAAWDAEEHEVARWCRLLAEAGVPADPGRLGLDDPGRPVPAGLGGATLIHPGAASPARRWPASRWAEVARAEAERGRRVVVTAGPGEHALATQVAEEAGPDAGVTVTSPPDVVHLASWMAAVGRVACADTGVAHLATALATPSVVLFGPVPPSQWGPPPLGRHRALWAGLLGDPHGCAPDAGLLRLGVEEVVEALVQVGSRDPSPRNSALSPSRLVPTPSGR